MGHGDSNWRTGGPTKGTACVKWNNEGLMCSKTEESLAGMESRPGSEELGCKRERGTLTEAQLLPH